MAKPTLSLPILSLFLLLLSFNLGGPLKMANGQPTWCTVNPMASKSVLAANLDYACSHVDCQLIQQGGSCFYPNTHIHHAAFAMNLYYQSMGRHISDCSFKNTGLVSLTDPSHGSCTFQSGGPLADEQSSDTWCVAKPETSDDLLQENLNFACNHVDCSPTQDGGPCFNPTTLMNHASFAMNLYYQTTGKNSSSCDFDGTGLIVTNDPSYRRCAYESH